MGKVQGGMKCVKYLLYVFHLIFWLSGCMVTAVGLWLRFEPDTTELLKDDAPTIYFIAPYVLICGGGLMMLVGFFGCCGAMRESQCLLGLFFASLLIIFGGEVAAGVMGFMNRDNVVDEIKGYYLNSLHDSNSTSTTNTYHRILQCCGTESTSPEDKDALCPDLTDTSKDCIVAISEFFNGKFDIIGYVGIGTAGVMIIGMIFSMVLCCAIRNSRDLI